MVAVLVNMDGRAVAEKVLSEVQGEVKALASKGVSPCLAVVLVGIDPASQLYVGRKVAKSAELGIKSKKIELPENVSEKELLALVEKLNSDEKINGILVQFPLPNHIDSRKVRAAVLPEKDVDGLHPFNAGRLAEKDEALAPCTPKGIMRLLEEYGVEVAGKNVVVIGRSALVGRPAAQMLVNRDATVTICHSKTKNLKKLSPICLPPG